MNSFIQKILAPFQPTSPISIGATPQGTSFIPLTVLNNPLPRGDGGDPTMMFESGIDEMLTQMLMQVDPDLTAADLQPLTADKEWDRLKNIVRLSQTGDGWDHEVARETIATSVAQMGGKSIDRRTAIKLIAVGLLGGLGMMAVSCTPLASENDDDGNWQEYFKKNFRLMTDEEKAATVSRLTSKYEKKTGQTVDISVAGPLPGVLYGYAFNISKCRGYMDCVRGCLAENNQDRATDMRYIRIHEHKQGEMNFGEAVENYTHQVPAADRYYVGTQCFHCENPPCVPVCPVKATWKEADGIVVVDYDWCIGCRYCLAACPYDARRFNWADPVIDEEEVNLVQHYLGNRLRKKGVTEKCTFCIQRTRAGRSPACVEACPTGARVFGNLLDPESELRWILKNKKVFRLKEELGTEPKFWYFMD